MRAADVQDSLLICGTSVLGRWVADLVSDLGGAASPSPERHELHRDQSLEDLGRTDGHPRIFTVRSPGRATMDAIEARRVAVIAVLDDPVDSVRFFKQAEGCDVLQALRDQTSHAAAHHLLVDNPAVTLLHRGFGGSARELVAAVRDELGLHVEGEALDRILEAFGGPAEAPWSLEQALERRVPDYVRLDRIAEAIPAEEATLVRQVLSPLVLGAISRDIGAVTWPARVFLYGDKPNEVAPAVADVTGGARIIYYGPYFHLPPGGWTGRLIVAFSLEARGTPFRLVLYCNHKAIAKVLIRPSDGGAFEGAFTFWHEEPEHNIELHFMNDEGSIGGHMALGQITFTKLEE